MIHKINFEKKSCMHSALSPLLFAFCFFVSLLVADVSADDSLISKDLSLLKDDYRNFYLDTNNLIRSGVGIAGAAVLANTSMDVDIQDYYQDRLRGNTTDSFAGAFKVPGEVFITIPALLGTHLFLSDTTGAGLWAQRSLRAIAVGAPTVLLLQNITGGARPSEDDSKWRPFEQSHGVSGHAFIGAVPFITAAVMNDNPYIKGALYGFSVLPGLSRINDNKHYISQAALGWYLAYLSCSAVDQTNRKRNETGLSLVPLPEGGLKVVWSKEF
jgi:hypothetical protein